jgi:MFS family permease
MESNKLTSRHVLTLIGACLLMSSVALGTTCLSFFVAPITQQFGFSRAGFTFYVSLITFASMFSLPFIGKQIPKIGIKKLVLIGGIWCSLAFVWLSFSTSLISFYLAGVFMGIMLFCITSMAAVVIVNMWFVAKKGLFMGIVLASSGVSGAILSMILPGFIATNGWQNGYLLLAALMFILTVPVGLFILVDYPQKVGKVPYGYVDNKGAHGAAAATTTKAGVPYGKALKTSSFYALYLMIAVLALIAALSQHLPANFTGNGMKPAEVGSLMSIMMIALIFIKIVLGAINDKAGSIVAIGLVAVISAVAFFLMPSSSYIMLSVAMVLYSFLAASTTVVPPLMCAQMFGQKDYTGIWGIYATAGSVGMTIGTPLWGAVYDMTKSYTVGFYGAMGLLVVAFLLAVYSMTSARKLVHEE